MGGLSADLFSSDAGEAKSAADVIHCKLCTFHYTIQTIDQLVERDQRFLVSDGCSIHRIQRGAQTFLR